MRFVQFNKGRLGLLRGDEVVDVTELLGEDRDWPPTMTIRLIEGFDSRRREFEERGTNGNGTPLAGVTVESSVTHPSKVVGAYANYRAHHREMGGSDERESPEVFLKAPSSIIGPGEAIRLPDLPGRAIHHEAELAVVMKTRAKGVKAKQAMKHVFGYTGLMDITVRGKGERSRRKSYDGFTPIGPVLVTADEIQDPHDLDIALWVDDVQRQKANTRDMIFGVSELIEYTSAVMTLEPGDVIATGTPEGVGPIKAGNTVTLEVSGIGRLTVHVQRSNGMI
jgi:2-keto-4-pentenoate hydratase/2-oxohepta-3-ene-1,7-dioic acid hydratase in catechol pathway